MTCERFSMPGGGFAIVCGPPRRRKRCACGRPATLECDWKERSRKSGTCDKPICSRCATTPAEDEAKDLCPDHAVTYRAWRAAHS